MDKILEKLIAVSKQLANPFYELIILGEGNTSASCGDGTIWIKASGSRLANANEKIFSRVQLDKVMDLLEKDLTDEEIEKGLVATLVDPKMKKPSVETFLHSIFIKEAGIKWVGHSHPISVMSILCSKEGAKPFLQHLFPDEIVMCGEHVAVVPYVDPGLTLSRAVRKSLRAYLDAHGYAPKMLLMENHGLVALGQTPEDIINISIMADKWAKTILGTYTMNGPRYLTKEQANRIETRQDEDYRRNQLSQSLKSK